MKQLFLSYRISKENKEILGGTNMNKLYSILIMGWSLFTIFFFYNSFEKLYDEKVNNLMQSPVLSNEECSQYIGGLVGKSEDSKISKVKVSGKIRLPIGCRNIIAGGIVGQDNGSEMKDLESNFEIEYYDPNKTNPNFLKVHILPIMQSVIAAFVAYIISFVYKRFRERISITR